MAKLLAIADAAGQTTLPKCRLGRESVTSRWPLIRQRIIYGLLLSAGLSLAARFGIYWFSPTRLSHSFGRHLNPGDVVLFTALTFVVWHRLLMDLLGWIICSRVEPHRDPPYPPTGLRVAFITSFVPASESIDVLRQTLASMIVADYPHDTWVLDEGDSAAVRGLCHLLGVRHFSRHGKAHYNTETGQFLRKSKGGNHNSWYAEYADDYDVVAQVDSDFKVRRDFLTRTLGHFRNQRVAFVGTHRSMAMSTTGSHEAPPSRPTCSTVP